MARDINKLKKMIELFEKRYGYMFHDVFSNASEESKAEFRDILEFAEKVLPERQYFIDEASDNTTSTRFSYSREGTFIEGLKDFVSMEESFEEKLEERKLFLGAEEQLKIAADNLQNGLESKNFGPVFSPLGTAVDLALKDKLELPVTLTIREASVKKMLQIIGQHTTLGKFCDEIYKNVYDVRSKIEHEGYNPTQGQAIEALKISEDFIRKLKSFSIPQDTIKEIHEKAF
jgi:hypothetical protein